MNHSSLLPLTAKILEERSSDISLYLSSNKMLLGIDLANIDVIIFLRPYDQPSALVQGGGRGGRKSESGKRRMVQVYQLFNSQDLGKQHKSMSPMMRKICLSKECTRNLLTSFFVGNSQEKAVPIPVYPSHCCHNCDREN